MFISCPTQLIKTPLTTTTTTTSPSHITNQTKQNKKKMLQLSPPLLRHLFIPFSWKCNNKTNGCVCLYESRPNNR